MKKFYVFPIALCLLSQGFASTSTAAASNDKAQEYTEDADKGTIADQSSDDPSTAMTKKEKRAKREEEKKKQARKKSEEQMLREKSTIPSGPAGASQGAPAGRGQFPSGPQQQMPEGPSSGK